MDALIEKLDTKLREWEPNTAAEVRRQVAEIINLADQDLLDIMQSRYVEQEVLNLIDEPLRNPTVGAISDWRPCHYFII